MICDIVCLPRRLKQFNHDATINSELTISLPISCITRIFGFNNYNDDSYVGVGSIHKVITGKHTPFRYKFIEPTKYGIAEYFVLTETPIDIRCPIRSRRVKLYCPWVTITDPNTFKVRKFIIWNGVRDLIRFEVEDSVHDVPIEMVIRNELKNFAMLHDRPDLIESIESGSNNRETLISEESNSRDVNLDHLVMLGSNILAFDELSNVTDPCHCPDAIEIFRGWEMLPNQQHLKLAPLNSCTLINHFVYGAQTLGDLRHLFGMNYDAHPFQRNFDLRPLDPYTELSIDSATDPDLFGVMKYIEHLDYSEFSINHIKANGVATCEIFIYNPYDPLLRVPKIDEAISKEVWNNIAGPLDRVYGDFTSVNIRRSWSDEIYITIESKGKTDHYYFDLVSAELGSRTFIRDYDGHLFN